MGCVVRYGPAARAFRNERIGNTCLAPSAGRPIVPDASFCAWCVGRSKRVRFDPWRGHCAWNQKAGSTVSWTGETIVRISGQPHCSLFSKLTRHSIFAEWLPRAVLGPSLNVLRPARRWRWDYLRSGATIVDRKGSGFGVWDGRPGHGFHALSHGAAVALRVGGRTYL